MGCVTIYMCQLGNNLFPLLEPSGVSLVFFFFFYFDFKVKGEGSGTIMCCLSPQPRLALDSPTCRRRSVTKRKCNIHILHHCMSPPPVNFADDTELMRDDQVWGCH